MGKYLRRRNGKLSCKKAQESMAYRTTVSRRAALVSPV